MKNIKELCEVSINCTCEKEETSAGLFRSWVLHQQEYIRLDLISAVKTKRFANSFFVKCAAETNLC